VILGWAMSYHVYLITDVEGCWPLIAHSALPWRDMRTDLLLVYPRGDFEHIEDALALASVIRAVASQQPGTPRQLALVLRPPD
jgi:hypothetical protein